jgi:predicted small secreted protein
MKTTAFSLLVAVSLALSGVAFGAGKDYQVTGPVLEMDLKA